MTPLFARMFDALDARLSLRAPARATANKVFPAHWSFLLGEMALISFGVLVATGLFLTMFYRPSTEQVLYQGAAPLYDGRQLPYAFESVIRLSHDVPGGLLFRRIHRAASHLFIATLIAHLLRVWLTGAFRRPREVNWHVGGLLLVLATASGWTGHNLLFDSLAGNSLRIAYSFLLSIPWVGEPVALFVFGGEFPTGQAIPRLFALHILLLPAGIAALIGVHLLLVVRQKHTQRPHPEVDGDEEVVGEPLWPAQLATTTTLALSMGALLAAAAVLVPWSDVDLHGPYLVAQAVNAAQPDWFTFWMEGALRLLPAIELTLLGATISGPFFVGIALPLAAIVSLAAYPWLERRVAGDDGRDHHVLQHPLDVPFRFGMVVAAAVFFAVLTVAAGNDIAARLLRVSTESTLRVLRAAAVLGPPLLGVAAAAYARRWGGGAWAPAPPDAPAPEMADERLRSG